MHQLPRSAPRSTTPANSAQANPSRTNNPRQGMPSRTPSSQDLTLETDRPLSRQHQDMRPLSDDDKTKINQIIQHFFAKAALTILSSRVSLAPLLTKNGDARIDRWFNTQLEEAETLAQDLRDWRIADWFRTRPTPLIIEIYLDLSQLAQNQSLVVLDEEGRSWDVSEALQNMSAASSSRQAPTKLVYERWTIDLDNGPIAPSTANDTAPGIYKRGVVAIRTLFTYTKFMPAWRLGRRLGRQAGNGPMLKPRHRIIDPSMVNSPDTDTLICPLFPSDQSAAETFQFNPFDCCIGPITTSVVYRRNCEFVVEPTERLLSTKAMRSAQESRMDMVPAVPQRGSNTIPNTGTDTQSRRVSSYDPQGQGGSTSSGDILPDRSSLAERSSLSRPSRLSSDISSARNAGNQQIPRRTSVSFQPFKAGSLSSSPGAGMYVGSPSSSVGRSGTNISSSHIRNRSSITTLPQQVLRAPQLASETAVTSSASSSPKPAPLQRYSSSFSNRRSRFPSSGNFKADDDNLSSGRASVSSAHRGSGILPEPEASPSSANADDDNIADFLKLLDKNKGLQSFSKTDQAATTQRTAAQYSKYVRMRDSTTQLTDSMSSSLMLHRSSSSSSRQLHNVPGMIAGSSFSTSSSPGKPISPHTPHMPAIPSRLSNNSIVADYSRETSRSRPIMTRAPNSGDGSARTRSPPRSHGTPASTAIDIPTSPRTFPAGRRSSSAAQQARIRPEVEEPDPSLPYGLRSASLPNDQGGELSLSELLTQTDSGSVARRRRDLHTATLADDDDEPLLFALAE